MGALSDHQLKNPIYVFQLHAIVPRAPEITVAMMHLLPIQWMLRIALMAVGLAMVAATYAGWVGTGETTHDTALVVSWSSVAAISLVILFFAAWRWIPPIQRAIFPYLGGRWIGYLEFEVKKDLSHSMLPDPEIYPRITLASPGRNRTSPSTWTGTTLLRRHRHRTRCRRIPRSSCASIRRGPQRSEMVARNGHILLALHFSARKM